MWRKDMKRKIFFLGDFVSDNGPGVANGILKRELGECSGIIYSKAQGMGNRIAEMVSQIIKCDTLFICNYTRLHIFAAVFAKMLGKKCVYRLHGYQYYETKVNHPDISPKHLEKIRRNERRLFRSADKIICVSKLSMQFMKKNEEKYVEKFTYAYNGIDLKELQEIEGKIQASGKQQQIMSAGGGIRQKNNRKVCEAIAGLNQSGYAIQYIVVGTPGADKDEICQYDFVQYYDSLPREDVLRLMKQSQLYIQNSYMETFGIALVEAVCCGCSILAAKNIGAVEIFSSIQPQDIIEDNMDADEIADKIKGILTEENHTRLYSKMEIDKIDAKAASEKLYKEVICGQ